MLAKTPLPKSTFNHFLLTFNDLYHDSVLYEKEKSICAVNLSIKALNWHLLAANLT